MSKKIILFPEMLASILKNKEEDIFCLWLIAKQIDFENKGIVKQNELLNIAKLTLGLSSNHTYTKINKGIDKYWREPHGKNGNKTLGLISIDKIIDRLKPEITRVKPVLIDINLLKADGKNLKNIRNLFISIVAARYNDNRPISMYSLIHNTGLSENTIRNALKDSVFVKTLNNYKIISKSTNRSDLIEHFKQNTNPLSLKIIHNDGIYTLLQRIGNSYLLNDFDRASLKKRPRSLRINDKRMLDLLSDQRYNYDGNNKFLDNKIIVSYLA